MMYQLHQKANWALRCLHVSSKLQLGKEFELVRNLVSDLGGAHFLQFLGEISQFIGFPPPLEVTPSFKKS